MAKKKKKTEKKDKQKGLTADEVLDIAIGNMQRAIRALQMLRQ